MEDNNGALARTVFHVAWMSILAGVGIEVALVSVAAGFGPLNRSAPFLADLVQKVSWSTIVCVGLAFGKAAGALRPHLTGLLGFLAAPVAFTVARALHKSAEKALGLASVAGGPSPLLVAGLKAVQYLLLGALLGWLARRGEGPLAFVTAGLGVAVALGGVVLAVLDWHAAQPLMGAGLAGRAVNELLFPVGCSLVIYAGDALARKVKRQAS
jgi:hypothetical protein